MDIQIHYDPNGEWAALYVNGELRTVGDAYLAEEQALELTGVKVVQDDAFLRGQGAASGVAQTVEQVDEYRTERERRHAEAARLRQQAQELLDRANQIGA